MRKILFVTIVALGNFGSCTDDSGGETLEVESTIEGSLRQLRVSVDSGFRGKTYPLPSGLPLPQFKVTQVFDNTSNRLTVTLVAPPLKPCNDTRTFESELVGRDVVLNIHDEVATPSARCFGSKDEKVIIFGVTSTVEPRVLVKHTRVKMDSGEPTIIQAPRLLGQTDPRTR